MRYSNNFDAGDQISCEESIAARIYQYQSEQYDPEGDDASLTVEDCSDLSRILLQQVLSWFRPDLMETE